MMGFLRLLAKGKVLRGTTFDLFGYQAERRQERQLIADYEGLVRGVLPQLGRLNYDIAVQLAAVPDQIRGFGHVKDKSIQDAKTAQDRLIRAFHRDNTVPEHSAA
jgi:indolepyruvate ferredoxin oxidoreductase